MSRQTSTLDAELVKTYPRDFKNIPTGTAYGEGADEAANKVEEDQRMESKLDILKETLKKAPSRPLLSCPVNLKAPLSVSTAVCSEFELAMCPLAACWQLSTQCRPIMCLFPHVIPEAVWLT